MCLTSLGTLGLSYAAKSGKSALVGGGAGVAGFGTSLALASAGRREEAVYAGLGASVASAAAYYPAWRATRSGVLLNAAGMSLVSIIFYGYKRQHPEFS